MGIYRSILLPSLLCLLLFPFASTAQVITVQGYDPIPLSDQLTPATPPESIIQLLSHNQAVDQGLWYQFSLKNNDALTKLWLVKFRKLSHQSLDLFIPKKKGYSLKQLGSKTRESHLSPNTVRLKLTDKGTTSLPYYIRIQSPYPNQLNARLLPESVHALEQYKAFGATTFFQTIAALLLAITLSQLISRRKAIYLLLSSHLLSVNFLLLINQTGFLHWLPPAGDPGHWMIIVSTLVLLTAIGCYQQINKLSHYADYFHGALLAGSLATLGCVLLGVLLPEQSELLLPSAVSCLIITALTLIANTLYSALNGIKPAKYALTGEAIIFVGLAISLLHTPWPRSIPTFAEYSLIVAQASFLAILHWYNNQLELKQAAAISILNPLQEKRRIFEMDLRQYLVKPETPFHPSELPSEILATLKAVLPDSPATVITRQKKQWLLTGTHNAVTEDLRQQLPKLNNDISEVIKDNESSRIHLQDAKGGTYWLLPLEAHADYQTLLVINPVISSDNKRHWHIACDIASHSKTLYKASRQTYYWRRQATIDELTGLPDKTVFTREAEDYLFAANNKETPQCCLLMIGFSQFKQADNCTSHTESERTMTLVAKNCARSLRQQDLLCKYDQNKLAILLPETNPWQAWQVAERLYKLIECQSDITDTTLSIGMSAHIINTSSLDMLLQEADNALRNAQIHSRHRIIRGPSCQDHRLPS